MSNYKLICYIYIINPKSHTYNFIRFILTHVIQELTILSLHPRM